MADLHEYRLENVVGAFSALSPRITWNKNCEALVGLLEDGETHLGFQYNVRKAKNLLHAADPLKDLNAKGWSHKTHEFAKAILGCTNAVVLDTWMLRIMGYPKIKRWHQYETQARQVRLASSLVGERPAHFQATLWIKERNNAK
jgi:hypothetical protein